MGDNPTITLWGLETHHGRDVKTDKQFCFIKITRNALSLDGLVTWRHFKLE